MTDELNEAAEKYAYIGIPDEMKSIVKPIAEEVIKNFIAGAKWQKEQMLKDAVEADVNTYTDLAAGKSWAEFVVRMPTKDLGDKVRIIIVKEEEK